MAKRPTPFVQPPGHTISFFPSLVPVAGSVKAAVLLCQLVYWTPRTKNSDGWIYKSQLQLMQETGMSRHELHQSRAQLKRRGLLADRYGRADHRLYLRVNVENYNAAIGLISEDEPKEARPKSGRGRSEKRTCQIRKADVADPKSGFRSSTEITPETTTETTTTTTPPDEPVVEVVDPPVAVAQREEANAEDGGVGSDPPLWRQFYDAYPWQYVDEAKVRAEWERQDLDATVLAVCLAKLPWQRSLTGRHAIPDCAHIYLRRRRWRDAPPASAHGSTHDDLHAWYVREFGDDGDGSPADQTDASDGPPALIPDGPQGLPCKAPQCGEGVAAALSDTKCERHAMQTLDEEVSYIFRNIREHHGPLADAAEAERARRAIAQEVGKYHPNGCQDAVLSRVLALYDNYRGGAELTREQMMAAIAETVRAARTEAR
jgi:hypothetical protein